MCEYVYGQRESRAFSTIESLIFMFFKLLELILLKRLSKLSENKHLWNGGYHERENNIFAVTIVKIYLTKKTRI